MMCLSADCSGKDGVGRACEELSLLVRTCDLRPQPTSVCCDVMFSECSCPGAQTPSSPPPPPPGSGFHGPVEARDPRVIVVSPEVGRAGARGGSARCWRKGGSSRRCIPPSPSPPPPPPRHYGHAVTGAGPARDADVGPFPAAVRLHPGPEVVLSACELHAATAVNTRWSGRV